MTTRDKLVVGRMSYTFKDACSAITSYSIFAFIPYQFKANKLVYMKVVWLKEKAESQDKIAKDRFLLHIVNNWCLDGLLYITKFVAHMQTCPTYLKTFCLKGNEVANFATSLMWDIQGL